MRLNMGRCVAVFAVLAIVGGGLHAPLTAGDDKEKPKPKPKATFAGKWKYQSFRPEPVSLSAKYEDPKFVKWSPPGVVTIDEGGTTGKLVFTTPKGTLELKLKIALTAGDPATVSISAVMNLSATKKFTNELQGTFVPSKIGDAIGPNNPLVIRGSIVQTSDDIASPGQPIFTTGFFVLEPLN